MLKLIHKKQSKLANEMASFLNELPASVGLEWAKDFRTLYYFEAERVEAICCALQDSGFNADEDFSVLDFGYLHGLIPEFVHRQFPGSHFTVCDRPDSPIFSDKNYLDVIKRRQYLELVPMDILNVLNLGKKFDVIILGEIIEHLDPTFVAKILVDLRKCVTENGVIVITTPNGSGFYNSTAPLFSREKPILPPIADKTMGYPHIHLWSPGILSETLSFAGWSAEEIYYNHGKENDMFARSWRHWGSFKHQIYIKLTQLLCCIVPKWRGFFVLTAKPISK